MSLQIIKHRAPPTKKKVMFTFLILVLLAFPGCQSNDGVSRSEGSGDRAFLDWPSVLSIEVEPSLLYDTEKGIVANFSKKGRQWEAPSTVSFYQDGALILRTSAGLRVHGGTSRRRERKSFRLYFRNSYDSKLFPFQILKPGSKKKMNRLVVHSDRRRQWHALNAIGYDIGRKISAPAPHTHPVRFFLNGEDGELYFITERIDRSFFKRHFGHDKFEFMRYTGREHLAGNLPPLYAALEERVRDETAPLTFDEVSSLVDLKNLVRWTIAQAYVGNADAFQGVAARDTKSDGKWFWILWDMDHGFRGRGVVPMARSYEKESFQPLLNKRDIRSRLLTRLIAESEEFRDFFAEEFCDILSTRLTEAFMKERISHYKDLLAAYGMPNDRFARIVTNFARKRPEVLKSHFTQILNDNRELACP